MGVGVNRAHRSLCSPGAIILNRPFIIARGSRGALINLPGTCRIIVKSKAKFRPRTRPGSARRVASRRGAARSARNATGRTFLCEINDPWHIVSSETRLFPGSLRKRAILALSRRSHGNRVHSWRALVDERGAVWRRRDGDGARERDAETAVEIESYVRQCAVTSACALSPVRVYVLRAREGARGKGGRFGGDKRRNGEEAKERQPL